VFGRWQQETGHDFTTGKVFHLQIQIFVPHEDRMSRNFYSFSFEETFHLFPPESSCSKVRGQATCTISVLTALLLEFQTFSAVLHKLCFTSNISWNLKWLSGVSFDRATINQFRIFCISRGFATNNSSRRPFQRLKQEQSTSELKFCQYSVVLVIPIITYTNTADKTASSLNNPDGHMLRFDLQLQLCR